MCCPLIFILTQQAQCLKITKIVSYLNFHLFQKLNPTSPKIKYLVILVLVDFGQKKFGALGFNWQKRSLLRSQCCKMRLFKWFSKHCEQVVGRMDEKKKVEEQKSPISSLSSNKEQWVCHENPLVMHTMIVSPTFWYYFFFQSNNNNDIYII